VELNPTITVKCDELAKMFKVPDGLTILDAWSTAYEDGITFEYGPKEV
jgi:hypothetical protein